MILTVSLTYTPQSYFGRQLCCATIDVESTVNVLKSRVLVIRLVSNHKGHTLGTITTFFDTDAPTTGFVAEHPLSVSCTRRN